MSFEMLRDGQSNMLENLAGPMASMPGFEAMQAQQQAFLKAMTGGLPGAWGGGEASETKAAKPAPSGELDEIKKQLAELQSKLSKL